MRSSPAVWVLSTVPMGVLGGVLSRPYVLNKTTTAGISQPYPYGTRLPIPIQASPCPSSKGYEIATNSSIPTALQSSNSSTAIPYHIPSPSTANVVPSLPAEILPAYSSWPNAVYTLTQLPTFVYSPLSSPAILTYSSSTSASTPDHTFVVTVVISKTVFNAPTSISSVNLYPGSPPSTSRPLSPQPEITASAAPNSSMGASSAVQSSVSPIITDTVARVALQASPSINLPLLSSIFYGSEIIQRSISIRTTTVTTVVIIDITAPGPLPTSSLGTMPVAPTIGITTSVAVPPSPSRSSTAASPVATSADVPGVSTSGSVSPTNVTPTSVNPSEGVTTGFPTLPPFSHDPSASRGSASPITRPTPEPSSANIAGSTLGTATVPTSTFISQYSGIPPAPSAAGASGGLNGKAKETVWWVVFFVPFMFVA
ncbi:hypothetical protein PTTW11_03655 [Pyrenophora teres f. teres]|uniref:Herpes-BLLF1 multi-domain protein n=1 Tax=Pyrenophora teres f. teres TaxID=97479 RepID=A0A6S6VWZ0_9PLEO|nr:hypothetical protein PTTW11_03655 [Pyrenophora teres f. teres]